MSFTKRSMKPVKTTTLEKLHVISLFENKNTNAKLVSRQSSHTIYIQSQAIVYLENTCHIVQNRETRRNQKVTLISTGHQPPFWLYISHRILLKSSFKESTHLQLVYSWSWLLMEKASFTIFINKVFAFIHPNWYIKNTMCVIASHQIAACCHGGTCQRYHKYIYAQSLIQTCDWSKSLIASATPSTEKSESSDGTSTFLAFTLFLSQPLWEALVTSKVHPPPLRVKSQYVFIPLRPGGLIEYWPSDS